MSQCSLACSDTSTHLLCSNQFPSCHLRNHYFVAAQGCWTSQWNNIRMPLSPQEKNANCKSQDEYKAFHKSRSVKLMYRSTFTRAGNSCLTRHLQRTPQSERKWCNMDLTSSGLSRWTAWPEFWTMWVRPCCLLLVWLMILLSSFVASSTYFWSFWPAIRQTGAVSELRLSHNDGDLPGEAWDSSSADSACPWGLLLYLWFMIFPNLLQDNSISASMHQPWLYQVASWVCSLQMTK